jgi:hypothetical protein
MPRAPLTLLALVVLVALTLACGGFFDGHL